MTVDVDSWMPHQAEIYRECFDSNSKFLALTGPRQSPGKTEIGLAVAVSAAAGLGERVGYLTSEHDLSRNNLERALEWAEDADSPSIKKVMRGYGYEAIEFTSGGVVRFWTLGNTRVPAYGPRCRWILDDIVFSDREKAAIIMPLHTVSQHAPVLYLGYSKKDMPMNPFAVDKHWHFGIEKSERTSDRDVWLRVHKPGLNANLTTMSVIEKLYHAMPEETFRREMLNG